VSNTCTSLLVAGRPNHSTDTKTKQQAADATKATGGSTRRRNANAVSDATATATATHEGGVLRALHVADLIALVQAASSNGLPGFWHQHALYTDPASSQPHRRQMTRQSQVHTSDVAEL